jgi:hypothetical protein
MQLCFIWFLCPRHPVHWISQCFLKVTNYAAKNCICGSLKTIKTPFNILKLQLKLVQHVLTQLGHPQATHLHLHLSPNQYRAHGGSSGSPQQHSEAANTNGSVKCP